MANSYLMQNMIVFTDANDTEYSNLNSMIEQFYVSESYGLDLTWKFLNHKIFENTISFGFEYDINSIDANIFGVSRKMREIYFNPNCLIKIIRKQGIGWIKSIIYDLNVYLKSEIEKSRDCLVSIYLHASRDIVLSTNHFAEDHDFLSFH